MAEGTDSSKASARRRHRVQASWNSRPASSTGTSGRSLARPGQGSAVTFVAPGGDRNNNSNNNNNNTNIDTDDTDDDPGWVLPVSLHKMAVVDVHRNNLKKLGYADLEDWLKNPDHVYIGRDMTKHVPGAIGSKWGNPFKSKERGRRAECCNRYTEYVKRDRTLHDGGKTLRHSLDELKGKTLGCWCHPKRCHGHMLVELVNKLCKDTCT